MTSVPERLSVLSFVSLRRRFNPASVILVLREVEPRQVFEFLQLFQPVIRDISKRYPENLQRFVLPRVPSIRRH